MWVPNTYVQEGLISRDRCFVENWKMSHFSYIDIAFCSMLFKGIFGYAKMD